jgi:hypothetical protein
LPTVCKQHAGGGLLAEENERALFRSAIVAEELPFCVLHIYGPGGVGKTTLLKEFMAICMETQTPLIHIDARNVDPSPEAFVAALQMALGISASESPVEVVISKSRRHVLLIDTYELLAPLDTWIREVFLPQMPEDMLTVFADRRPPSPGWSTDPGWQDTLHVLPLRNLKPEESQDYLARRNIPPEHHREVLNFTHGHPLALSLVADVFAQRGDIPFQPEATPDVVKVLLEQLVQKVPGPAHRTALEVCALVRVTTESLLAAALDLEDAHELFDWLRGLSFIEAGPMGLFPHDLAREALVADVRWRNRDWYAELHRRVRSYYSANLEKASPLEQQRILFDYVFLHRDNPLVRPFLEWQETGGSLPTGLQAGDVPELLAMVSRHEGEESAGLAQHWLERLPHSVLIFRDADKRPIGFMMVLALEQLGEADAALDPAVRATLTYLQRTLPLHAGEIAFLFRFWMARDTYQDVSPTQSLLFINAVRHYFTPGLVYSFLPCADADFWAPLFAYADLQRIPEADFEVGGRRYGTYGRNWKASPPMAWLGILGEREIANAPASPPQPRANTPLVMLSQPDFMAAVQDALRNFARPDALQRSVLLQSRIVTERAGAASPSAKRAAALQGLLKEAAEIMNRSPRDAKLYRAVYHTYISPAATQEQAAELLDLPFSTFRRHLKEGISRLSEIMWQWELEGTGS